MRRIGSNAVAIDVYFDFVCPFAYNAAVWLSAVKSRMKDKLTIDWKYFCLEQVNNKLGSDWKIWEQPEDYSSRSLLAFIAAEAARSQGELAFASFHAALYRAKHELGCDIADLNTLIEVAEDAGLDKMRFSQDISQRKLLSKLAEDHTLAVDTLGVFGVPTLVFPENKAVFVKMAEPPPPGESLTVFDELRHLAEKRPDILEVKRPRPAKT